MRTTSIVAPEPGSVRGEQLGHGVAVVLAGMVLAGMVLARLPPGPLVD
ncbi:MAG: hypothetical protein M3Q87_02020 [Actinomycetota bacterium]|nr:hypothetical protein [Actinomycetota bacterium]